MEASDAAKMKELEQENDGLNKMFVAITIEKLSIKNLIKKVVAPRLK